MIKLTKGDKPKILIENETIWRTEYIFSNNKARRYAHDEIKEALRKETHDKCAYCEGKVKGTAYGHVEHIIPKSYNSDLVVDWNNLTLACEVCNVEKRDKYDPDVPMINPYIDDPRNYFFFSGETIFALNGNNRAQLTIDTIKLNRTSLLESRLDLLKDLAKLEKIWERETDEKSKQALEVFLMECIEAKAIFSACVCDFLSGTSFKKVIDNARG